MQGNNPVQNPSATVAEVGDGISKAFFTVRVKTIRAL